MKPIELSELNKHQENPEQQERRDEVEAFWNSKADYAEMKYCNKNISVQAEKSDYDKASRQLMLGPSYIRFSISGKKVYAQRLREKDFAVHELRIPQKYFEASISGKKKFEIQQDDRDYKVGDHLVLKAWDGEKYTGMQHTVVISYILRNAPDHGLKNGYCVLGWE